MLALLLTADLACSSQATGAAARAAVPLEVVMSVPKLIERSAEAAPKLVILDLNTPSLDCQNVLDHLQTLMPKPHSIAFGPHVHAGRLDAARQAGCDQVLSRGEFYARLDELLKVHAGGMRNAQ